MLRPRFYWLALAVVFLSTRPLSAGLFFEAETSGTFTTSGELPLLTVDVVHAIDSSNPFQFESMVGQQQANVLTGEISNGTFTFFAANNDTMFGTYAGFAVPRDPDNPVELDVFSTFVVTGGTGQFAGLSFSGTANGFVQFTSSNSGVSRLTWSAVPEPGFGLLLGGIGILFSLKRRRVLVQRELE